MTTAIERRHELADHASRFRYTVVTAGCEPLIEGILARALPPELHVIGANSDECVLELFRLHEVGVLLLGPGLSNVQVLALLERLNREVPHSLAVRVVVCPDPTIEHMRALMNVGHVSCSLELPCSPEELTRAIGAALDRYALATENERRAHELARTERPLARENGNLRQPVSGTHGFDRIIGDSPALRATLSKLDRIGRSEAMVHISGETGTGKEMVARALHDRSPRSRGPYLVQNCAGMTEALLQSTLFGHRKGSFTGADRHHAGLFLEADGGTLFLDEVAELSLATQASLLRVLQEGEITPVGANRPTKVDVRVLSATHKNLLDEVRSGRFREDLYYRLVVLVVNLPPLRERAGDVALLAHHFLAVHCEKYQRKLSGFSREALFALEEYSWPGNIRELNNEIERAVVLAEEGGPLDITLFSPAIRPAEHEHSATELQYDHAIVRLQRQLIRSALDRAGGSISRAANLLGIERTRLGKLRTRLRL